jgi:hypothetical protein
MSSEDEPSGIPTPFRALFVELSQERIDKLRRVTTFDPDHISPQLLAPLRRAQMAAVLRRIDEDPAGYLEEMQRITRKAKASAARAMALFVELGEIDPPTPSGAPR